MNQQIYENIKFMEPFGLKDSQKGKTFVAQVKEMPIHMHDGMEFIYLLKGFIEIKISFNHYQMKAGDFLLINPFEVHKIQAQDEAEILFLQADQSVFQGKEFVFDPFFYSNFHIEEVHQLKRLMVDAYCLSYAGDTALMGERLAQIGNICDETFQMHLFDVNHKEETAFAGHETNRERIRSITEYMYDQYYEKVKLSDVAGLGHIDMFYASRLIKDGMGTSFQNTLNIIRADRAEIFLLGTDLPVQQVGETVGFSSHTYFVRQFKELFHMTPSAYRRKLKGQTYPIQRMDYGLRHYDADALSKAVGMLEVDRQERTEDQYLMDLEEALAYIQHLSTLICVSHKDNGTLSFSRQAGKIEVYNKATGMQLIIHEKDMK